MSAPTFKVHYQATEPVPSWTAWRQWQTGALSIHAGYAQYESRTGERVLIRDVVTVSQPSRSQLRREHDISWMVNTWIAVHHVDGGQLRTAYFNDARFLAHYMSHTRMRRRLDGLIAIPSQLNASAEGRSPEVEPVVGGPEIRRQFPTLAIAAGNLAGFALVGIGARVSGFLVVLGLVIALATTVVGSRRIRK